MLDYKTPIDEINKCRYCGENSEQKFKSKAHLVPEFAGKINLLCLNECDSCNNLFSEYERNLKNFGSFKNSFLPIKGKNGFPKYKDYEFSFRSEFKDEKTLIASIFDKKDFIKIEPNGFKQKSAPTPFIPLYVYKALAKMGVSMLHPNELSKFETLINWIQKKDLIIETDLPLTLVLNKKGKPLIKPMAILLKKKAKVNSPEFSFIFVWGFYRFQIFLPYNPNDKDLVNNDVTLPISYDLVLKSGENGISFNHFDMSSIIKIKTLEEISFGLK
ncbi:hypothetical protein [Flavivirga spongiicola]|uniref:HNH endonuclease 5 domain-containing protein n=1 Tax=Flavivirga spongiicola TaxID=421621 RepID=A0ABU7XWJ8_9FLAO|nr:hypothetical protein [Flavivirga sp. MEBiC05379]MDO5979878.1 hypothetical protein [Flavivirga sp. MEBiC05379]